jgi:hypothetical protein
MGKLQKQACRTSNIPHVLGPEFVARNEKIYYDYL